MICIPGKETTRQSINKQELWPGLKLVILFYQKEKQRYEWCSSYYKDEYISLSFRKGNTLKSI